MTPGEYTARLKNGKIKITKNEILTEGIRERNPILIALTEEKIDKNRYRPRKWITKFYETKEKWENTLKIFLKHKLYTKPNYLPEAIKKLRSWGSNKTTLFKIATILFQKRVPRRMEKYEAAEAHLNWLSAIIAGKEPKFTHICQAGNCIKNPKLPVRIYTEEMALLLGIISGDGSFYRVKDGDREKIILSVINSNRDFLNRVAKIIKNIFGDFKPSLLKSKNTLQIRYYSRLITEAIALAGAHIGRKSQDFSVPHWIKTNPKYMINWFKGLIDCDGYLKIDIRKRDFNLSYSRNVEHQLPKSIINTILREGIKSEIAMQYHLKASMINKEKIPKPKIIKDEEIMIQELIGVKPSTRIERAFFNTKTGRVTIKWIVAVYGKHALRILEKTKPPRIWRKFQRNKNKIIWI